MQLVLLFIFSFSMAMKCQSHSWGKISGKPPAKLPLVVNFQPVGHVATRQEEFVFQGDRDETGGKVFCTAVLADSRVLLLPENAHTYPPAPRLRQTVVPERQLVGGSNCALKHSGHDRRVIEMPARFSGR
jgi:hypothetical protein